MSIPHGTCNSLDIKVLAQKVSTVWYATVIIRFLETFG